MRPTSPNTTSTTTNTTTSTTTTSKTLPPNKKTSINGAVIFTMIFTLVVHIVPSSSLSPPSSSEAEGGRAYGGWMSRREGEKGRLLEKVVKGVEVGLDFFSADLSDINLDGLFGMRIGQGQIIAALRECQSSGSCPRRLQRRLEALKDRLEITARRALNYVEVRDPVYLQRFLATVNQPYLLPYRPVTLTHLDDTPAGSDSSYDEEDGDRCFSRVLGTFMEAGKAVEACNVTAACWAKMTQSHRSRYSITHQLLFFILIEKQGCRQTVERTMDANVTEAEASMCGSIYNEAVAEVKDGAVSDGDQDIFMEQVVVCGCLGFENFLRIDWIRMVLTWQKAIGCFSSENPDTMRREYILSNLEMETRQLMRSLKQEVHMIKRQHPGRKLLRETVMKDGCLSHKSGLGFGNLCLFTRFLVRQIYLHQ
ncbi:hypothetical protein ACOMHN_041521 [Nucella lapillus]